MARGPRGRSRVVATEQRRPVQRTVIRTVHDPLPPKYIPVGPIGFQKRLPVPAAAAAERTREPDTVAGAKPRRREAAVSSVSEGGCKPRPRSGRSKGGNSRRFVPHCRRR